MNKLKKACVVNCLSLVTNDLIGACGGCRRRRPSRAVNNWPICMLLSTPASLTRLIIYMLWNISPCADTPECWQAVGTSSGNVPSLLIWGTMTSRGFSLFFPLFLLGNALDRRFLVPIPKLQFRNWNEEFTEMKFNAGNAILEMKCLKY